MRVSYPRLNSNLAMRAPLLASNSKFKISRWGLPKCPMVSKFKILGWRPLNDFWCQNSELSDRGTLDELCHYDVKIQSRRSKLRLNFSILFLIYFAFPRSHLCIYKRPNWQSKRSIFVQDFEFSNFRSRTSDFGDLTHLKFLLTFYFSVFPNE